MSVMSSLRRSIYGVPPKDEEKFRYFRKANAERGETHRRAKEILRRELARKDARRNGSA